jgi:hypothetical protein
MVTFPQFFIKEVSPYGFFSRSKSSEIIPIEEFCEGGSIAGFDEIFKKFKTAYCASNGNVTETVEHSHDVEDVGYADGYCVGIEIVKSKRAENLYVADCTCAPHEGGPSGEKCFIFSTDRSVLENN